MLVSCATINTSSVEDVEKPKNSNNKLLSAISETDLISSSKTYPKVRISSSNIVAQIQMSPILKSAESQILNSFMQGELIEIQKGPNFGLSSNLGLQKDQDNSELAAVIAINGSKNIYDSGRSENQKSLSRYSVEATKIEYLSRLNNKLYEILRAIVEQEYAKSLDQLLKANQSEYNKNKNLLELAYSNGIITSFDMLTLNEKMVGQSRRALEIKRLKNKSQNTINKLKVDVSSYSHTPFIYKKIAKDLSKSKSKSNVNLDVVTLQNQIEIGKLTIEQERLSKALNVDLAGKISQGLSSTESPDIFAGFQVTLPMFDNGKADQKVSIAEQSIVENRLKLTSLENEIKNEIKFWNQELVLQDATILSMEEEISIAERKIVELEKMMNIGRVSLKEVVTEKLNLAALKTSKIDNSYQYDFKLLDLLTQTNSLCLIIAECSEFDPRNLMVY